MDRKILIQWLNEGTVSIPSILIQDYKKLKLTENEVMLLIHVFSFLQKGIHFPTPNMLAERMSFSELECMQLLQSLMKRGFLVLQQTNDDENDYSEAFSLTPLWDKLIALSCIEQVDEKKELKEIDEKTVYELFEKEFARPLSPIECELITMWLDQEHYKPSLIKAALMEAVVSGKRNLRYIDRILIEWTKNGVRTVQEAKDYGQKFRNHQAKTATQKSSEPKKKLPSYNWLQD